MDHYIESKAGVPSGFWRGESPAEALAMAHRHGQPLDHVFVVYDKEKR